MALILTALCLLQALAVGLGQAPPPTASQEQLQQAVAQGVQTMATLAQQQLEAVEALEAAVAGGNLTGAQEAYLTSRPAYEQIELLAYGFPEIDSDLDARPIEFAAGEADTTSPSEAEPGEVFLGFHRLEGLIFRDGNLSGAQPYAAKLVNTTQELIAALQNGSNFSPAGTFASLIDEGTEIAGKKISSEEETWSDLSILIFYNNFLGIQEIYQPFKPLLEQANPATAAQVDDAFAAAFAAVDPYAPRIGDTIDYRPYSYVTVVERAPIQAAGYDLTSVMKQAATDLGVELEEEEEEDECTPSVQAAQISASSPQIQNGLDYFRALLPVQQEHAANLTTAIEANDLEAARAAYLRMRPFYEQIEVLAASFPDIDSDIDAREYAFPAGEKDPAFKGNHHLEALLYRDSDTGPQTIAYAQGLQESFNQLDTVFAEQGNDDEVFNPTKNFGGIIGLATEVVAKKVSSEEEKYSDHSWLIFYNNYKGLYSQAVPFFNAETADLKSQLDRAVQDVIACMPVETQDQVLDLDVAADGATFTDNLANANYGLYSRATPEQRACTVQQGYVVRQVLVEAAAALNLLDDCSSYYPEVEALRAATGSAPSPSVAASSV